MNPPTSLTVSNPLPPKVEQASNDPGDIQREILLLHQFDALTLGEGNLMAGSNLLAAMALTIANTAPPGSCLTDPNDGTSIPVGMNVLTHGSLSCSLVEDNVLRVIENRQSNVFGHIHQKLAKGKQRVERISETDLFPGSEEKAPAPTLLDRLKRDFYFSEKDYEHELLHIFAPPAETDADEITEAPVIFAGIGSTEGLANSMKFAHRGRLMAHTNLMKRDGAKLLTNAFEELVTGCPRRTTVSSSIRGEVFATDPMASLDSLLTSEDPAADCLERMLWLCDQSVGPEVEIPSSVANQPKLNRVNVCFECALNGMMMRRFNFHETKPVEMKIRFAPAQVKWNAFLGKLEPRFPGIVRTLRPLLASLTFGLEKIINAASVDGLIKFSIHQIFAFARMLALRMSNVRALILDEHERVRLENLAASFHLKLMEGSHTVRELMRRSDNINAHSCRLALELLVNRGQAVCSGRKWQLVNLTPALTIDA
jgi:hypothetical protein